MTGIVKLQLIYVFTFKKIKGLAKWLIQGRHVTQACPLEFDPQDPLGRKSEPASTDTTSSALHTCAMIHTCPAPINKEMLFKEETSEIVSEIINRRGEGKAI